jgi:hypothetical protein
VTTTNPATDDHAAPDRPADDIAAALTFDPLATAERITGSSYKDDPATADLGLGLALTHNLRKEDLLKRSADSYMNMSFVEQMDLFTDLGFGQAYRETFAGHAGPDTYVILWHPDGLLATCESYTGTHRNTASVYYNYRHQSGSYPGFHLTSSGRLHDDVWVGNHDAREGIRHNLDAMRAEGTFLADWLEQPYLSLLNYSEWKGENPPYKAITASKIAALPEHVRTAISPPAADRDAEAAR